MDVRSKSAKLIGKIDDDQRFADAARVLRILEDGHREIERLLDVHALERHLKNPKVQRAEILQQRLDEKRATAPQSKSEKVTEPQMPPDVARALAIISGNIPPPKPLALDAQVAALTADLETIADAIRTQAEIVAELRATISAEVARRLQSDHRAIALDMFRALQTLAAAVDRERAMHIAVHSGGFTWVADLLPLPTSRAAIAVGSEREPDSDVSRFRRLLQTARIL